jgi:HK97 family phage portal protein
MNFVTRLSNFARLTAVSWRASKSTTEDGIWHEFGWSVPSVTGIPINMQTALNAAAVMACVTMISEDFAKLPAALITKTTDGTRKVVTDHFLSKLLEEPNDWQNWLEFCEQMTAGLVMRSNAYAVVIRDGRGTPIKLIPINPDRCALWEAPDGNLFYRVTPSGLHEIAQLRGQPFLIPSMDMLHLRGFSLNGLLGAGRISLAREAIGVLLAQEQQAARWMGNAAKPSGMLTTDQKLTPDAANRLAADIKQNWTGLQNSGKIIVGEQGLKFLPFSMTSQDLEFIASREFQLTEVARLFRIPPHMIGILDRTTGTTMVQMAQEYVNYTISGYAIRWQRKLRSHFGLAAENLTVEFDYSELTRADILSRYNAYRIGIMSSFLKPNEARLDDGKPPDPKGNDLLAPMNMSEMGSQSSGTGAGDGRPPANTTPV